MRHRLALVAALALLAPSFALADGPADPPAAKAKTKLQVHIDRAKVDLDAHHLEVTLSHTADKVKLKVLGDSGAVLAEVEQSFTGAAAGTPLVVSWTPSSDEAIARIEVWGYDSDGYYAGVAITPWSIDIPHEEVNFETDSDVIRPSETPKLNDSLKRIADALAAHKDLGAITLYVAGHTDTVGSAEHNLGLSRRRAHAIATWFRAHGLKIAIAFEGLGESAPLVKTADEVDEPRNRRVDYILGAEPPRWSSASAGFAWKTL